MAGHSYVSVARLAEPSAWSTRHAVMLLFDCGAGLQWDQGNVQRANSYETISTIPRIRPHGSVIHLRRPERSRAEFVTPSTEKLFDANLI
jgi:hypothetical protein